MFNFIKRLFVHSHEWRGAGWSNENVNKEHIGIHYLCDCGMRAIVLEPTHRMGKRFAGYREKYGNEIVYTNEFDAPKPGEYKTVYMSNKQYIKNYV